MPDKIEPRKQPRRGLDVELQTMARIDRMLAELEPDAIARVLAWLIDRHPDAPQGGQVNGQAQ